MQFLLSCCYFPPLRRAVFLFGVFPLRCCHSRIAASPLIFTACNHPVSGSGSVSGSEQLNFAPSFHFHPNSSPSSSFIRYLLEIITA